MTRGCHPVVLTIARVRVTNQEIKSITGRKTRSASLVGNARDRSAYPSTPVVWIALRMFRKPAQQRIS